MQHNGADFATQSKGGAVAEVVVEPMRVILLEWRPLLRNSLRGFATVQVGGLKIHDVTLHEKNGSRWAGLPARPVVVNGQAATDDRGKVRYATVLEWQTKEQAERFSAGVMLAVEAAYPEAFNAS
jgi:hypothetical protein